MLQAMRTGAKSILIKLVIFGLLAMATLGLALMDVQGMFRGGVQSTDIASFDGQKITTDEFDRILRPFLHQRQVTTEEAWRTGLIQNVLTGEIQNRLLAQAAADAGIIVDDREVSTRIRAIIAPLVKQGLGEKEALDRLLNGQSLSEQSLVAAVRREMGMELLLKAVAMGAYPPRQMISDAWGFRHEQRTGEYFVLSPQAVARDIKAPTDDELRSYYPTVQKALMRPEYRQIGVVVFGPQSVKDTGAVSDEAVRAAYDERQDEFTADETRSIAQVILSDEAVAKKLAASVAGGVALEKAAKTIDGARFIPAESYDAKSLAPEELAEPAFAAKSGGIVGPVKTALGWHVLRIESIKAGGAQSFDSVRESLRRDLTRQAQEDRLYKMSEEISDALAGGATLAQIAEDFGLDYKKFPEADVNGKTPDGRDAGLEKLPAHDKILATAFSLSEGMAGNMIEAPTGEFILTEALAVTPASVRPLEEVRSDVARIWTREKTDAALAALSHKLIDQIGKDGNMAAAARQAGATVVETTPMSRTTSRDQKGLPDTGYLPTLFSISKPGGVTVLDAADGGLIVVRVKKIIPAASPDPAKDKEELAGLENMLRRSLQEDTLSQYRLSLALKADVSINDELIDRLYQPRETNDAAASDEAE